MINIGQGVFGAAVGQVMTWTKESVVAWGERRAMTRAWRFLEQPTLIAFPVELSYYFVRERKVPAPRAVIYDARSLESLLGDDRVKVLYLLRNNRRMAGVDEVLQRMKDERRLELTTTQSFKGFEIYTFVPRGAAGD